MRHGRVRSPYVKNPQLIAVFGLGSDTAARTRRSRRSITPRNRLVSSTYDGALPRWRSQNVLNGSGRWSWPISLRQEVMNNLAQRRRREGPAKLKKQLVSTNSCKQTEFGTIRTKSYTYDFQFNFCTRYVQILGSEDIPNHNFSVTLVLTAKGLLRSRDHQRLCETTR